MSAGKTCSEQGCTYFAGSSGYCSSHSEEGKARSAAKQLEEVAKRERNLQEIRQGPAWWRDNRIRYPVGYERKSLILGASPTEPRRGRDYYDDPNVFLLGHEAVKGPRYIYADYSPAVRDDKLVQASNKYENTFDEIAFDGSTMCTFHAPPDSMVPIFGYFYKMLKENGVLFLSDYNPEIKMALELTGFLVHRVNVAHLGGTIVERLMLHNDNPELNYVCVAIKRTGGAAAPAPPHGGMRKLRKVRKSKKTRKAKKTRRH